MRRISTNKELNQVYNLLEASNDFDSDVDAAFGYNEVLAMCERYDLSVANHTKTQTLNTPEATVFRTSNIH
jgi:hypothetical protein